MQKFLLVCSTIIVIQPLCYSQVDDGNINRADKTTKVISPTDNYNQLIRDQENKVRESILRGEFEVAIREQQIILDLIKELESTSVVARWVAQNARVFLKELMYVRDLPVDKRQQFVAAFKSIQMASGLINTELYGDAQKLAGEAIKALQEIRAEDVKDRCNTLLCAAENTLGLSYLYAGFPKEALTHFNKAAVYSEAIYGSEYHPDHMDTLTQVGRALLDDNRFSEAEKQFRAILDQRRKCDPDYNVSYAQAQAFLAAASLGLERYSEAESLCMHSTIIAVQQNQKESAVVPYSQLVLAEICLVDGRYEKAKVHLEYALKFYEARTDNVYDKIRAYNVKAKLLEKTKMMDELEELKSKIQRLKVDLTKK